MILDVSGTRTRASAPQEQPSSDFQRSGGPRSVSGEPMEGKTMTAGARNETSPSRFSSGRERLVAGKRANCSCTKTRRPHLLAAGGLMDLPGFSLTQSRSRRQAVFAGRPSHPATHAGARPKMEITTTRAEQQRTVLVRRLKRRKVSVIQFARYASLRAGLRQLGSVFLFAYPGLTPWATNPSPLRGSRVGRRRPSPDYSNHLCASVSLW